MAQLDPRPCPGDWDLHIQDGENAEVWFRRTEALMQALRERADAVPEGQVTGRLIEFPVADGSAVYLVKSEKPLVLQHVPYCDAYRADHALIRGLTLEDVRFRLGFERRVLALVRPKSGLVRAHAEKTGAPLIDAGMTADLPAVVEEAQGLLRVEVGALTLWFSGAACVAFDAPGVGAIKVRHVRRGSKAEKHVVLLESDPRRWLPKQGFEHLLRQTLAGYGLTSAPTPPITGDEAVERLGINL